MTRALDDIAADGLGKAINPEWPATLSQYRTQRINRFGDYVLDMSITPQPQSFTLHQHLSLGEFESRLTILLFPGSS